MRSSSLWVSTILTASLLGSGCGLFGSKKEPDRIFSPQTNIGCLNGLGKKVGRYFKGTMEAQEWESMFACVEDQVIFFKKFVRGNSPDGYNPQDIGALVRDFLITEKTVSNDFIAGIFQLKASFFGGNVRVITQAELDEVLDLIRVLRRESLVVLPYIQARVNNPTIENLYAQADAIRAFGEKIAAHAESRVGNHVIHRDHLISFAEELLKLLDLDSALVHRYQEFIFNLKAIVAGGSDQGIEGYAWIPLIRHGSAFSGMLFAYRDFPKTTSKSANLEGEFYLGLAERAVLSLESILESHGGDLPVERLFPAINSLPMNLGEEKRQAIQQSLPKILKRALRGKVLGRLDIGSVHAMLGLYRDGTRAQTHLEKIYENIPATVTVAEFEAEALRYFEKLTTPRERNEVLELIEVAKTFVGLYPERSNVMYFSREMRGLRTRNHMIRMQWYKRVGDYVLSTYAADGTRLGTVKDLQNLTDDFIEVLTAWKLAHPRLTSSEMATKRFREANLFTPVSNGDHYMDPTETAYYFAYLFSTGKLASRTFRMMTKIARACPIIGIDEIGEPAVEAQCFREYYFGNFEVFWAGFPDLVESYRKMSSRQRATLQRSMELAARRNGVSEEPIGLFDINSFSALPHYVENVIDRFDRNGDQILSKKEILNYAYPVFKQTLITVSGKKQDWMLQAALTYAIKFKKMPKTKKEKAHFLTWAAWRPFWKVSADRGTLYQVLAILSAPPDKKETEE